MLELIFKSKTCWEEFTCGNGFQQDLLKSVWFSVLSPGLQIHALFCCPFFVVGSQMITIY